MATAVRKMVGVSADSSSSSDDEQLKRCQEAVWDTRTNTNSDNDNVKQSRRVVVADHDHDGNELQVTEGFRTHMAKKLSQLLDRHVSETQAVSSSPFAESANCNDDDEEGFRLFSTSVPGERADETPAPARRRPLPSSSDSDSEMETRLKEAAVSVQDLLPSSSLPPTDTPPSSEPPSSETKKKKKKKKVAETSEDDRAAKNTNRQVQCAASPGAPSIGQDADSEQEHKPVKRKKKKKKKRRREGNEEETLT